MSTNEDAVNKKPKRRRSTSKRRAKARSGSSAKQRTATDKKPRAETPIVITGGLKGGVIGFVFEDGHFDDAGNASGGGRVFTHKGSARVKRVEIVSILGKPLISPYTIPDDHRATCQIRVIYE